MNWQPIETAPKDGTFILAGLWLDTRASDVKHKLEDPNKVWWAELVFWERLGKTSRSKKRQLVAYDRP